MDRDEKEEEEPAEEFESALTYDVKIIVELSPFSSIFVF